jgi:hypothetical protein
VCALRVSPRSGRRCELQQPHPQGGMGCATRALDRDRRRWRHLRHRRLRWHHLLQRRVREHRRRCATELGGWSRGTGVLRVLAGYLGVPRGVWSTRGVVEGYLGGHPEGYPWAAMGYFGYSRVVSGSSGGTYLRARVDCACARVRVCVCVHGVRVGAFGCVCACASRGCRFARARVSECARVGVRASVCCSFYGGECAGFVCVSLCVCARAFVCVRGTLCGVSVPSASIVARMCAWVWACVCGTTVCVCLGAVRALWWHGGGRRC